MTRSVFRKYFLPKRKRQGILGSFGRSRLQTADTFGLTGNANIGASNFSLPVTFTGDAAVRPRRTRFVAIAVTLNRRHNTMLRQISRRSTNRRDQYLKNAKPQCCNEFHRQALLLAAAVTSSILQATKIPPKANLTHPDFSMAYHPACCRFELFK